MPAPPLEPTFEALSYSWGPTQLPITIRVRDPDGRETLLPLQPSLVEALRHLRHAENKRRMWIDAICINQQDHQEKSIHIPYMWAIYRHAWQTVVWLGPEHDDSHSAIGKLNYIANQSVLLRDGQTLPMPGDSDLDIFQDPYPILSNTDVVAIAQLLNREYFHRLWIVSELAMADVKAQIYCGVDSIRFYDFQKALHCLIASVSRPLPPLELASQVAKVRYLTLPTGSLPFTTVLELYRSQQCSNQLDKIYGLSSMASSAFAQNIPVNYQLKPADLYCEVSLSAMQFYGCLDLLQACRLDLKLNDCPSWVPNFSVPYQYWRPTELCSGIAEPVLNVVNERKLQISGIQCCTVKKVHEGFGDGADLRRILSTWYSALSSRAKTYPTGEAIEDVFCRTICLDRTRHRYPGAVNKEAKFRIEELRAFLEQVVMPVRDDTPLGKNFPDGALAAQVADFLNGRDFFETDNGYFGLGPGITRKGMISWFSDFCACTNMTGDIVCAFLGSTNLTLLRPQHDNTNHIVGHAFVHGFHDACAFLGPLPPQWRVVVLDDEYGGKRIRYRDLSQGGRDLVLEISDADTVHDPRLGDLPPGWRWYECERTKNDPDLFEEYYHEEEGYQHSDPRMSAAALTDRGVILQTFDLV